jgi:enamine deaminase RidA (YjgF/YER057c/UK114 family)
MAFLMCGITVLATSMIVERGASQQPKPEATKAESQPAGPPRRFINPPGLAASPRYSHVAEITGGARMILISGQVAQDAEGKVVGAGDMRAQSKQVFENLKIALASVGATFDNVVKLNTYMTDMSEAPFAAYRDVRTEYLKGLAMPPASTTVAVPRLVNPQYMLEVEAVAVIPARR